MIGDFVPETDEHWENYLLMVEITDYLMASQLLKDEHGYLKLQIEQHHSAFTRIYPGSSIKDALFSTHAKAIANIPVSYLDSIPHIQLPASATLP